VTQGKERERCRNHAYRLLSRRDHSCFELRAKLLAKGHGAAVTDDVIGELTEKRHLDDDAYCRRFAAARVGRMKLGPARIEQDLSRKGFAPGLVAETITELFRDDAQEMDIALKAAAKKLMGLRYDMEKETIKRKIYSYLARRGFSAQVSREIALDRLDTLITQTGDQRP